MLLTWEHVVALFAACVWLERCGASFGQGIEGPRTAPEKRADQARRLKRHKRERGWFPDVMRAY